MNQQEYMTALKKALTGIPSDQVEDILRDYEQHFYDAITHGRKPDEISEALGDPRKIALEFKAIMHLDAFQKKRSVGNFLRMLFAIVCLVFLVGFNFFLLPLALIMPFVTLVFYFISTLVLIGGLLVTASGVIGIDKIAMPHRNPSMELKIAEFNGSPAKLALETKNSTGRIGLPPYYIVYQPEQVASPLATKTTPKNIFRNEREESNEADRQTQIKGLRKAIIGAAYALTGIFLFWLSTKLSAFLWFTCVRYVRLNIKLLSKARESLS